jgi:hypothetical protein
MPGRHQDHFQDHESRHHLYRDRNRRWEAALVNTLSPGDKVLMVETGQFATLWKKMAEKLGLKPEFITTDWRIGADPAGDRGAPARRQGQGDQGGLLPAQ